MDPFVTGAGSMEEMRRADEHKRQQQRIAALEGEVRELKASLAEAQQQKTKAEAAAKAAANAAATESVSNRGRPPASRGQPASAVALPTPLAPAPAPASPGSDARVRELEATLAAIQRDVDTRDEQWRSSVAELTKRFNERLAKASQGQPPSGQPPAAAASFAASPLPNDTLAKLVASVESLRAELGDVKSTVRQLSTAAASGEAVVIATGKSGATRARGGRSQRTLFDQLGPGIAVDPATESAARESAAPSGVKSSEGEAAESSAASPGLPAPSSASAVAVEGTVSGRTLAAPYAGPQFGLKRAPKPPSLSQAAPKKRGRPPKNAVAEPDPAKAASEADAQRRRDLVAAAVRNADAASSVAGGALAASARVGDDNFVGAYLARRSAGNLTVRQTDDLRRKYTAIAGSVAEARGTSTSVVFADKLYEYIASQAHAWKQRSDTARTAMLHALEPLAFRSAFRELAVARIVDGLRWGADGATGALDADRQAPATFDPVIAHEVAACAAGWMTQESDIAAHGAFWFDVALAGLKTLRRVRDVNARRTACACLVASLRGLCRGKELVAAVNSHRATLVSLAIQHHVAAVLNTVVAPTTSAVTDSNIDGNSAAACRWWLDLCELLDWCPQPVPNVLPLLEERIRTVVARNRTLNQASVDAVLAMRIVAQGVSSGVELLYALARDSADKVTPPMVMLVGSLCLDFELAFADSDRFIAAYLVASFKGNGFAEVDTPAQLVAAVAVLTCSPVPPKPTAAFASELVAAAGHVRHLARKQHTTPSIRPVVSTTLGRAIIAKVDAFIALPK